MTRARTLAGLAVLGAANALLRPMAAAWRDGAPLTAVDPVVLLALGLGLWRTLRDDDGRPLRIVDGLAVVAGALVLLLPASQTSWLGTGLALAALAALGHGPRPIAAGPAILIAACLRDPLTQAVMTLFAGPLLALDAELAGLAAHLAGLAVTVDGNVVINANGHRLFVMTGCSSFSDVATGLLLWFALVRAFSSADQAVPWPHAAGLAMAIVAINLGRLALMSQSPAWYVLVHDGAGGQAASLLITAAALAAALWSQNRAVARA